MPVNSFDRYFLSWKPDRARLVRPWYLSLANALEEDIAQGRLAPGTRLPPQRELADFLGLNFTTVTRAYGLCREKHLLYGVTGSGTFVAPHAPAGKSTIIPAEREAIELGVVTGFDEVKQPVLAAAKAVLDKGYSRYLYSYREPAGYPHQREAGAHWMEQQDVCCGSDRTAIFSGAQNAISTALASLFRLGDRIATDEFTYANFITAAKMFHVQLTPVRGDRDGMAPDALAETCRKKKIAGLFLMPGCANPTARVLSESRKNALAEVAAAYNLTVLEDDSIGAVPSGGRRSLFSRLPEQTFYICGSTRNLCCGLRVAFAGFPERFRAPLLNGLYNLNIKTSPLDAEIVTELILSGKAKAILSKKRQLSVEANALYDRIFPGRSEPAPEGGFFRWLPIRTDRNGIQIEDELERRGVRVCHSRRFDVRGRADDNFLRLSISSAGSPERLEHGLQTVREYLAETES